MSQRKDFAAVAARNSITVILCCILGAAGGVFIAYKLPKKFKSISKFSIQASYFQNPLVDNLVAPVTDPAELQGQRVGLIQRALSDEFIEKIAQNVGETIPQEPTGIKKMLLQWGLAEPASPEQKKAELISSIRQRIEFFPESSTSFSLSFAAGTPELAQAIDNQMMDEVQQKLFDERRDTLANTKTSLERRAKSMGQMLENTPEPQLKAELDQTKAELSGLLLKFSPLHPLVQAEKSKLSKLASQMPAGSQGEGLSTAEQAPTKLVYEDIVKKLNFLTVVLDMESTRSNKGYVKVVEPPSYPLEATFPKKSIFFLFGGIAGLLIGSLIAFLNEQLRPQLLSADAAAEYLDSPLLTELPAFKLPREALADQSKALPPPVLKLPSR